MEGPGVVVGALLREGPGVVLGAGVVVAGGACKYAPYLSHGLQQGILPATRHTHPCYNWQCRVTMHQLASEDNACHVCPLKCKCALACLAAHQGGTGR